MSLGCTSRATVASRLLPFLVFVVDLNQNLATLVRLDHKLALFEVDFACLKVGLTYAHI